MPKATLQVLLSALIIFTGQALLLSFGQRNRLWRYWRTFQAFLMVSAGSSCVSLAILLLDRWTGQVSNLFPALYFYCFWISALTAALLQCGVLWTLVGRLTGQSHRVWLRSLFAAICLVSAAVAIGFTLRAPMPVFSWPVMRIVATINRAGWLAWCLVFVIITASADIAGLKWRRQLTGVALGFVLLAVSGTASSWLLTVDRAPLLDNVNTGATLVSLLVWALAFRESPSIEVTPRLRAALDLTLNRMETIQKG